MANGNGSMVKGGTMGVVEYIKQPAITQAIGKACSRYCTPERLVRVACAAISRQPLLGQCTKESMYLALTNCGQLGLEPNLLGAAYLVPFRNKQGQYEAQMIPGYRGLIELARRSGEIAKIEAHVVYANDSFDYSVGERPKHRRCEDEDQGEVRAAWALAVFKDGAEQVEVMFKRDLDRIRAKSRASNGGPWVTDYDEMCRKTVVRRLCKYLPLTIELADAIDHDTRVELADVPAVDVDVVDGEGVKESPAKKATKADALAQKLKVAEPVPDVPETVPDAAEPVEDQNLKEALRLVIAESPISESEVCACIAHNLTMGSKSNRSLDGLLTKHLSELAADDSAKLRSVLSELADASM